MNDRLGIVSERVDPVVLPIKRSAVVTVEECYAACAEVGLHYVLTTVAYTVYLKSVSEVRTCKCSADESRCLERRLVVKRP